MEPDLTPPPILPLPSPPRGLGAWRRVLIAVTALLVVVAVGFIIHLPAYAISPGPAEDVGKLIHVTGAKTYPHRGEFLLTTVSVTSGTITLWDAVRSWFNPDVELVPRSAIVAPGLSDQQQDALNRQDMEESKYLASVVGLRAAGLDVPRIPGARVMGVFPGTPAATALKVGDVIVAVDGVSMTGERAVAEAIRRRAIGAAVSLQVDRDSKRVSLTLKTTGDPENRKVPVIGVTLAEAFRIPVDVRFDTQDIGGPSGGLVFALAIVDSLSSRDITGGHRIATTGTISLDGTVGPIGGVAQKVRAAELAGADVFFVPASEAAEARKAARKVRIYGVSSVDDAVRILSQLAPAAAAQAAA